MNGYRRMSVKNATDFRRNNNGYSVYDCDIKYSNLVRDYSDDSKKPCKECTYLVNTHQYTLSLSELYSGKYDVIFVSPSWDTDEKTDA